VFAQQQQAASKQINESNRNGSGLQPSSPSFGKYWGRWEVEGRAKERRGGERNRVFTSRFEKKKRNSP